MFNIKMITPDGKYHETEVHRVTLPTTDGKRTVLDNHMQTVMTIESGVLTLIGMKGKGAADYTDIDMSVMDGIFHFKDNEARLYVRAYEFPDEIDVQRAKAARERALERLHNNLEETDRDRAKAALQRANIRLLVKQES